MPIPTKDSFVFDFTAQGDYPGWTPSQAKANFNARGEELRIALNAVANASNTELETITDLTTNRKLSATGDFTGTLGGFPIVYDQTGLASTVAGHTAQLADNAKQMVSVLMPPVPMVGGKGDGVNYDSTAIKNIIAYVASLGGGTVVFPYTREGYRLNHSTPIGIPKGVKLLGCGVDGAGYLSGGSVGLGYFQKSYFIMDEVTGSSAFTISDNSCMEKFGFYYKTVDTNLIVGELPTFPWTITGAGYGMNLLDLSTVGASHFINLERFERGTIDGIYGYVTKVAFRINRSRDISRINNIHINPNIVYPVIDGAVSESWSAYFMAHLKANVVIFRVGSADFYYFNDVLTYGSYKFLEIVPINYSDGLGDNFDSYTFTFQMNNVCADNTNIGIEVGRPLAFVANASNLIIVPIADNGSGVGIQFLSGASGLLNIVNYESMGVALKTSKHVIINSTGVSMVNIKSARMLNPGNDFNRLTYTDMFTVSGNNKLNVELVFGKTTGLGTYKTIHYSSDVQEFPQGIQTGGYVVKDNAGFIISKVDGADAEAYKLLQYDPINLSFNVLPSVPGAAIGAHTFRATSSVTAATDTGATGKAKSLGGGGILMLRSLSFGGFAVFAFDPSTGLTLIVNTGAVFITTGTPSAGQIKIAVSSVGTITFTAATGQPSSVNHTSLALYGA